MYKYTLWILYQTELFEFCVGGHGNQIPFPKVYVPNVKCIIFNHQIMSTHHRIASIHQSFSLLILRPSNQMLCDERHFL